MTLDSLKRSSETQEKMLEQMKTLNNQLQEMNTSLMNQVKDLRNELTELRFENAKNMQCATTEKATTEKATSNGTSCIENTENVAIAINDNQELVQLEDGNYVVVGKEALEGLTNTEMAKSSEKKRGISLRTVLSKKPGDGELITIEMHQKILQAVRIIYT
jgi:uncharacterized protein YlxW (UPF0749 family)